MQGISEGNERTAAPQKSIGILKMELPVVCIRVMSFIEE